MIHRNTRTFWFLSALLIVACATTPEWINPSVTLTVKDVTGKGVLLQIETAGRLGPLSLERREANEEWTVLWDAMPPETEGYLDEMVEPGTRYEYRVSVGNLRSDGVWAETPVD